MKSEKGITLVVLVLTIIVMLILSAVVIFEGIGQSGEGLIYEVKDQTEYQQNAIQKEEEKMNSVLKNQEEDWGL